MGPGHSRRQSSVTQVTDLPSDAIEPVPSFGTGPRAEWLVALGRVEKRFLLLLDTDRLLGPTVATALGTEAPNSGAM